jgi:DNA-binding NarL/FixJ family response regulator
MIRILITDDHSIIRNSLKHILIEEFKNIELGEAVSGKEALEKAKNEKWDVIIMDVNMAGQTGIETLKQMRKEGIETPVLVMSFNNDQGYAVRALKAGASGFIAKDNAFEDLLVATRFILLNNKKQIKKQHLDLVHLLNGKFALELLSSYETVIWNFVDSVKRIIKTSLVQR